MRTYELLLQEGIRAGQFGGDIEPHGDHAMGFVSFLGDTPLSGSVVDIGSGAGLPALILADAYPDSTWTLIERRTGRTELLSRAVHRLDLRDRVTVLAEDVAVAAHGPLRGSADWVTARSFGTPSETAELGSPFLRPGGSLVTSEPREVPITDRWPTTGLELAGLEFVEEWITSAGRYARFERTDAPCVSIPRRGSRKKPLFS